MAADDASARRAAALERWRRCTPDAGLTWGEPLTGDAFVALCCRHGLFAGDRNVLELGPGYGRIPLAMLAAGVPFAHYTGVDISHRNIEMLAANGHAFADIDFVEGAFDEVVLARHYDVVLSSLVLKHQYPTFLPSLVNVLRFCRRGASVCFDLLENDDAAGGRSDLATLVAAGPGRQHWEAGTATFVGKYTRGEVHMLLDAAGLDLVEFDEVRHSAAHGPRLVVIARQRSAGDLVQTR